MRFDVEIILLTSLPATHACNVTDTPPASKEHCTPDGAEYWAMVGKRKIPCFLWVTGLYFVLLWSNDKGAFRECISRSVGRAASRIMPHQCNAYADVGKEKVLNES